MNGFSSSVSPTRHAAGDRMRAMDDAATQTCMRATTIPTHKPVCTQRQCRHTNLCVHRGRRYDAGHGQCRHTDLHARHADVGIAAGDLDLRRLLPAVAHPLVHPVRRQHTHTRTYTHTHKHTRTHAHARTHAHTHPFPRPLSSLEGGIKRRRPSAGAPGPPPAHTCTPPPPSPPPFIA